MKLRIEPGLISYRLDFDELEQLLDQGQLEQDVPLPDSILSYRITCLPEGAKTTFQAGGQTFSLALAKDIIEEHKAALPSLKGISTIFPAQNGGTVEVSLEVNLKKKIKRALT